MNRKLIKYFSRLLLFAALFFVSVKAMAQDAGGQPEMATMLRQGKIYVVIGILVTIFAGIVIFLISQEIRLRKLEKKINDKHS